MIKSCGQLLWGMDKVIHAFGSAPFPQNYPGLHYMFLMFSYSTVSGRKHIKVYAIALQSMIDDTHTPKAN